MYKYYNICIAHIKTIYQIIKWLALSIVYYGSVHWFDCFCMVNFGTSVNFSIEADNITAENIKNNIDNLKQLAQKLFNVNVIGNTLNISYDHTYVDGLARANILKSLIKNKKINFTYEPNRIGTNLPFSLLYNYVYSTIYNFSYSNKISKSNWFSQLISSDELSYFVNKYNASTTIITVALICKYFSVFNKNKNSVVFHMFVNKRISEPKNNDGNITLGNYIDFVQFEFNNNDSLSDIISNMSLVITQLKTNYELTLLTNKPTKKPHFVINSWFFISSIMKVKSSCWLYGYKYNEPINKPSGNQSYFIIISPSNDNTAVEFGSDASWDMIEWEMFLTKYLKIE